MTIKEFIDKLEELRRKHGDDAEVHGWGDEAADIGIDLYKVVGAVKTADYMVDGKLDSERWLKIAHQFKALTSRQRDDGITEFLADIHGTTISL